MRGERKIDQSDGIPVLVGPGKQVCESQELIPQAATPVRVNNDSPAGRDGATVVPKGDQGIVRRRLLLFLR